jgi:hypothetical protein
MVASAAVRLPGLGAAENYDSVIRRLIREIPVRVAAAGSSSMLTSMNLHLPAVQQILRSVRASSAVSC